MDQGDAPRRCRDTDCDEILRGLEASQKRLPSKFFYDERGSALFDRICELPEYYVTRTERAIMQAHAGEMAQMLGENVRLVEFGSGSSVKTRLLLDRLDTAAYIPVDISSEHLHRTARELAQTYPTLPIQPLVADFTEPLLLPEESSESRSTAVYFPGSTLGNFEPAPATALLRNIRALVGNDGGLLIGADLQKDQRELEAAYDDAAGVTAEFNLNLLAHLNRDYGATFQLDAFKHLARYNTRHGRIEMHLVAQAAHDFTIFGERFSMRADETIHTENSYKYTLESLSALACASGFAPGRTWTDPAQRFVVQWWRGRKQSQCMAQAA
ncbi:MAG: methyltransferase [Nevskia sp.]|nr:methyltransferase [Nevskia sp.]